MSFRLFIFLIITSFYSLAHALEEENFPFFEISAPYALIMDYKTGIILYNKNGYKPVPPSSMSKIATVLMGFEALKSGEIKPNTQFVVSKNAWKTGGAASKSSTMFLTPGEKVNVMDLLKGIIIQSGNDASIALAEGLAGSEQAFIKKLNQRAIHWGLKNSHFMNASGLPEKGHISSLYDLAKLARITIKEHPEYYPLYAIKSMTWNKIKQYNRNPLLFGSNNNPQTDGLKTGHTSLAGYGLVASAKRGDQRRIIVMNGLKSEKERAKIANNMMKAAFDQFHVVNLYKKDEKIYELPVFMGEKAKIAITGKTDINLGVYQPQKDKLKIYIHYQSPIPTPIKQNNEIAKLVVEFENEILASWPLIAMEDVSVKKNIFDRVFTLIKSFIRNEI